MKKYITEQLLVEIILTLFFLICTLFHLIENKYFTAVIIFIIAAFLSVKYKVKRTIKPNYKNVFYVLLIFAIINVAFFYMFGLYSGFVKSSNFFLLQNFVKYIIPISIIILSLEVVRDRLLLSNSKLSFYFIVFITSLVDFAVYDNIYNLSNINGFLSFIGLIVLTSFANNIFYTYISKNYGMKPVIIYKMISILFIYIIPYSVNIYSFFRIFLNLIYPLFMYLYIDKYYDLDNYRKSNKIENRDAIDLGVFSVLVICFIALISCQFYYGVLVIGSGSMSGTIEKGDVILYKNIKRNIQEGDVIVFKRDNNRIVHRVISIKNVNHQVRIYTKGDNNPLMDEGYVTEDTLVGKVLFKIKYIGLPSLWFRKKFV